MNKATLQTWIRATIEEINLPISAEDLTTILKEKFSKEEKITVNRVKIILNQLQAAGIIRSFFNESANETFYLT